MRSSLLLISILLLGSTEAQSQTTWTVDDDGPADFSSIQAAIDFAAPGDKIQVASGDYPPFLMDRPLSLFGDSADRPKVSSLSEAQQVGYFNISDLALAGFAATGVPGKSVIQGCEIGYFSQASLLLNDVQRIYIRDTDVFGAPGWPIAEDAMHVVGGSYVIMDDSRAWGGFNFGGLNPSCWSAPIAGDALLVAGDSEVWLVDSYAGGGATQFCSSGFITYPGVPGTGIVANGSSTVHVRSKGEFSSTTSIAVDGNSTIFLSDGPLPGDITGSGNIIDYGPEQPYLTLSSGSKIGSTHKIDLYASLGQLAVLFVGQNPAFIEASDLYGSDIWLALNGNTLLLPLAPTGFSNPVATSWTSPNIPDALGARLVCQAGVLDPVSFQWSATNPVDLLLSL